MFVQTLFGKPVYAALTVAALGIGAMSTIYSLDTFCDFYNITSMAEIMRRLSDTTEHFVVDTPVFTAAAAVFVIIFLLLGTIGSKTARLERAGNAFMFASARYIVYALLILEGAFSFYGFAVYSCGLPSRSPLNGAVYLAAGAAVTLLALNKLFSLEVEI